MRDGEPPLDPAAERVRRKLARLLLGSFGIMALGLIAVFAAIVYKLSAAGEGDETPARSRLAASDAVTPETFDGGPIALPAGGEITAIGLDGERALLHVAGPPGSRVLLLIDLRTGAIVGRYELAAE